MCGRARCTLRVDDIPRACNLNGRTVRTVDTDRYQPAYNVSPGFNMPVVRRDDGSDCQGAVVQVMKWGLIPSFTKKTEKPDHYRMFNARSESISEKASFRRLVPSSRCLVAVEGFYEWKKDGSKKQPYYIHFKDGRSLVFAALYDSWKNSEGEILYTFTIITTSSSSALEWLHDRMPVILGNKGLTDAWLDGSSSSKYDTMLKPYEEPDLAWYPVTPAMGKPSFNEPDCIKEIQLKSEEIKPISSFFKKKGSTSDEQAKSESKEPTMIIKGKSVQEESEMNEKISEESKVGFEVDEHFQAKRDFDEFTGTANAGIDVLSKSPKKKKANDRVAGHKQQPTLFSYFGKDLLLDSKKTEFTETMVTRPPLIRKRFLCTKIFNDNKQNQNQHNLHHRKWGVKQVTKSNFAESLQEMKNHITESDFVALSLQKTGSYSAPWHRILPLDTPETAYLKAKYAAERFQILQFAVCPFSIRASKVISHPYNFHLFPRDELKLGMPSYSFSCQSSYLTSMAKEGFDFNVCIYEGISYLSKAQESAAKVQIGTPVSNNYTLQPPLPHSVADTVFVGRIKSRVKQWINACKDSNSKSDEALIRSLRKLILGSEEYGSRPCLSIDVCSERQVQLVLETLTEISDDVVPLLIPVKGGGTRAVRFILTSSKEDKDLFHKELQNLEEEENKKFRGFREVIDLISTSQKPVVAHNSLNDFAFIHSKFLSPLPATVDEFRISLASAFLHVLDIGHLMKEISPMNKKTDLPSAISYMKKRFFAPVDMEIQISHQEETNECKTHLGHNVLKITELFAKICSILKISTETPKALETHINVFNPYSNNTEDPLNDDVKILTNNPTKIRANDLVFLWGFKVGLSASNLKSLLSGSHKVFTGEFDVLLVDKSCAVVVVRDPHHVLEDFFADVECGGNCSEDLREMIVNGLRASSYDIYKRMCMLGLWESDLADSFERVLAEFGDEKLESESKESTEVYWDSDLMINLDEL